MSKYKEVISITPILVDIKVNDEQWLWVESKVTSKSMPNYINVFLVQSLKGSTIKEGS